MFHPKETTRKLLEEAPSSPIDEEKRAILGATIVKALEISYINAGTMEFLWTAVTTFISWK